MLGARGRSLLVGWAESARLDGRSLSLEPAIATLLNTGLWSQG